MSEGHDTARIKRMRIFLAFVLFALISLLFACICLRASVVSPTFIESKLTSYEYVSEYRNMLVEYADDVYTRNGIPTDNIENVITYDAADELAVAYINSIIEAKTGYTAETVDEYINTLEDDIKDDIKTQLAKTDYKYKDSAAAELAEKIGSYAEEKITVPQASRLVTVTNIGSIVSVVAAVISGIFAAVLALIIYVLGEKQKRYRNVRAIAISFMSAGFFGLFFSLIVIIISKIKIIDIYPLYLREALMSYVYGCDGMVAICSAVLLIISLLVCTAVWKMKRNRS